jgi:probable phosphoglycerate mutase
MNTTHFLLVRHGETLWNAERRLQGWLDIPINDTGRKQAAQLARHLASAAFTTDIHAVYSSDLSRAYDTACIATPHMDKPILRDPRLRERSYGIYQGEAWSSLSKASDGKALIDFRNPDLAVEGGESYLEFSKRVSSAFEDIARQHPGQNVLVFTHGGVIDIAWRCGTGATLEAQRPFPILNVSINRCGIRGPGDWFIQDWGYTGHLEAEALDDVL